MAATLAGANLLWPQQGASQSQTVRPVGTIKSISGNSITLRTDAGTDMTVLARGMTRFLRVTPEQKDLKNASTIELKDLQVGDRILVSGRLGEDLQSIVASTIVAIKASDVQAKLQKERAEWQRGVGGLVATVDAASGTLSISETAPGGLHKIVIQTTKDTIFRRYAPNSVNFDDAKPSSLDQIKPGDQVRARGSAGAVAGEFAAAEIVSGSFRNIAGTVTSIDIFANTIVVADLATKKPVTVRIALDSQVRKLPPEIAQRIAMALRMAKAGAAGGTMPRGPSGPAPSGGEPSRGGPGGMGRAPDLQQVLGRLPQSTIADLQKGDAVMIVSAEDASSGTVTAITLLAGVEPILTSPGGGQGMTLSPWNIGGGTGGEAEAQ